MTLMDFQIVTRRVLAVLLVTNLKTLTQTGRTAKSTSPLPHSSYDAQRVTLKVARSG